MLKQAGVAAAAVLVWGEWWNWRRSRFPAAAGEGAAEAVVVLGYRNPQPAANFVNRWRVRAGLRSIRVPDRTRVIFSGGATGDGPAEARLMAGYAKSVLGHDGPVLIEDESRTTWENITNVIPLLEHVDRIRIVSQPAHAFKARVHLRRQRPDLAAKLAPADDYRFGEWLLLKPLLALHGIRSLRGLEPGERKLPPWPGRRAQSSWAMPSEHREPASAIRS
ncbi:YdcF family protein [Amycolatopsis jiangsuensis]|uniref:Uncharacterized SAM-binding protein YcdF (DUF218 family) n=1 Tax=Amycolatopsis jiangsuensis TaxID=1181879 RepID=A0A840J5D4_9PSEU|nr:YdcF family protein [Amycolatopsis jiangsuensis]MBB4689013.1 uncharacterized SAM-binding protein YcdF (DUF218 family) [Amycolatopsis jiangsuensis]